MIFESKEEWKQAIRDTFKAETGCTNAYADTQADAFADMYQDDDLKDLPTPFECYQAEMQASCG